MDVPLIYKIDGLRRCIHVTYQFQPTFPEWEETMERIFRDPSYRSGFGMLLDRRKVRHPAGTEYVRRMVAFMENSAMRTGVARWALLVTDMGSFGMARMAEQLAMSDRVRAFRDLDQAQAWTETTVVAA